MTAPGPDFYQVRPLGPWTDPQTEQRRGAHLFKASWEATLDLLCREVDFLDGKYPVVIQVDVEERQIRRDGMLHANAVVNHPGAAISFSSRFGPLRYATDAYEWQYGRGLKSWQANIRAIALALQALRAVDRYGVSKRGEQYTGWASIAPASSIFADADEALQFLRRLWHEDFESDEPGTAAMYRALARKHHPDNADGSREVWDRLEAAVRLLGLTSGASR